MEWNKSHRARRRTISKTQRKQKAVVSSSLPRSTDRLPVCALPAKEALEAVSMETNWIIRGDPAAAAPGSLGLWTRGNECKV